MKPHDPFEERLRRQPLRGVPPEWRKEILAAAAASQPRESSSVAELVAGWRLLMRELFWPAPRAWAGLAAVWVAILALGMANRESTAPSLARQEVAATPLVRELRREQQQLFAELVGPTESRPADRPKPAALPPRSQGREEFVYV